MRAGIIAAGEGSRFRAAGLTTPKPLLQVAGRSLLERTLAGLAAAGVTEVALIVNEAMAEVAEAAHRLSLPLPLHIATVIRTTASSMHSLYHLREQLEGERFVLCTVDTVLRTDELRGFVAHFAARRELDLLLAYTDFIDDEKPLYIGIGDAAVVTGLGQAAQGSPFVTAGLYGMSPLIWPVLEQAVGSGLERLRNFLALLLARGLRVGGYRISQAVDVDRPSDLQVAEDFLRRVGEV